MCGSYLVVVERLVSLSEHERYMLAGDLFLLVGSLMSEILILSVQNKKQSPCPQGYKVGLWANPSLL